MVTCLRFLAFLLFFTSLYAARKPKPKGCRVGKTIYNEGQTLPVNPSRPCEVCVCKKSKIECSALSCPTPQEGFCVKEGECCPSPPPCRAPCTTPFQSIPVVVKKGKKTYKFNCNFMMVYNNEGVVTSKSSVKCKPSKGPKGLKAKVILKGEYKLQFDVMVSMSPFAITAATCNEELTSVKPVTKEPVTEGPPGTNCEICDSTIEGQRCGQDGGPLHMNCTQCCSSSACARWRCDAGGWMCQNQCTSDPGEGDCIYNNRMYPLGETINIVDKCSMLSCKEGRLGPQWDIEIVGFSCCQYNGHLLKDGDEVVLYNGQVAKCCDGQMVAAIDIPGGIGVVTTTAHSLCDQPSHPQNGKWNCRNDRNDLSCSLECDLGYILKNMPNANNVTCSNGVWRPLSPEGTSIFQCLVPVALLTGGALSAKPHSNKVEIFSPYGQCSPSLPDLPNPRYGHSLNVLEDRIVLCGDCWNVKPTCIQMNKGTYMWRNFSNSQDDHCHLNTLVNQESLILLGGQFQKKEETDEIWDGNTWQYYKTEPYFWNHGGCATKIDRDNYIVMGGYKTTHETSVQVLMYTLRSKKVTQLPDLLIGRMYEACTFVKNTSFTGILLSGRGNSELYDLSSNTSVLVGELNIPRQGHSMMVLGDKIVAIGGRAYDGGRTKSVEEFSMSTQTWSLSKYQLKYDHWYAGAMPIQEPDNSCCGCSK